jgi:hypothetical protein
MKLVTAILVVAMSAALAGCGQGPKGDKGDKGDPGKDGAGGAFLRVAAVNGATARCDDYETLVSAYCAAPGAEAPSTATILSREGNNIPVGARCGAGSSPVVICSRLDLQKPR